MNYEEIMRLTNMMLVVLFGCLTVCAVAMTVLGVLEAIRIFKEGK